MRRVLIVSFDFPPQGGTGVIRVTKFAKYLPEFGWQPVVVCSDTMWNPDESLARDVPDVPVYRVGWPRWTQAIRSNPPKAAPDALPMPDKMSRGMPLRQKLAQTLRRILVPDVNVLWIGKAYQTCLQVLQESSFDAVMTTSPPNSIHLIGRKLHARLGLPWVADFRDAWTVGNQALHDLGGLHFARQRRVEQRILEACDRAVMVTDLLTQQTQQIFGPQVAPKCLTITNGFDPEDFIGPSPVVTSNKFVITYAGTILGPQVNNAFPEGLRLALEQSADFRNAVSVRFIGQLAPDYHARFAGLEAYVDVADFVTHEVAIATMRQAHVLLLVLPHTELARMTFTNKFFEYLAARRPILALAPPGLISDIIAQEQIGIIALPDNTNAIAQALLEMFETVRVRPDGYCPSDALLARFDRRELTGQLATIFNEIAG
ncbi:MAG TPA: glycosyltransferase [Anaerolineae bacterium]|nr:glycosyltransferase [Anaerolineae bacterium]HQH37338.1 glycosyltransferase [Anaerolineae bacterium]